MATDFSEHWLKCWYILTWIHGVMSSICKLMSALFLVTKQKWYGIFNMSDLEIRQYVVAFGQLAITIETQR